MYYDQSVNLKHGSGKNILAIDYGQKNVGLASFMAGSDPYPLIFDTLPYRGDQELFTALKNIVAVEGFDVVVLGLPTLLDGGHTDMTRRVLRFASILMKLEAELILQDEALSTFEAKERMKVSPRFNFTIDLALVDALSAAIILESYVYGDGSGQLPLDLIPGFVYP